MAKVVVRRSFAFKRLRLRPTPQDMRKAGDLLVQKTVDRTRNGRDENNRSLAPLKDGGRSTLTETGQMLDDYQVITASPTQVGLGFRTRRSAQLAEWHESGTRHLPKRRFLGIPQAWIREVRSFLAGRLKL